jgi:hypothetical protein
MAYSEAWTVTKTGQILYGQSRFNNAFYQNTEMPKAMALTVEIDLKRSRTKPLAYLRKKVFCSIKSTQET